MIMIIVTMTIKKDHLALAAGYRAGIYTSWSGWCVFALCVLCAVSVSLCTPLRSERRRLLRPVTFVLRLLLQRCGSARKEKEVGCS